MIVDMYCAVRDALKACPALAHAISTSVSDIVWLGALTEEDCDYDCDYDCGHRFLTCDSTNFPADIDAPRVDAKEPTEVIVDLARSSRKGEFAINVMAGVDAQCRCCSTTQHNVVSLSSINIDQQCGYIAFGIDSFKSGGFEGACSSRVCPRGWREWRPRRHSSPCQRSY